MFGHNFPVYSFSYGNLFEGNTKINSNIFLEKIKSQTARTLPMVQPKNIFTQCFHKKN